ncbi:MAG: PIN domain-containing protein [Candidatus Woesearchaeota archaeon]
MNIVIDSNKIIAALIKDNVSRQIIYNKKFTFIAPDYCKVEIEKYSQLIIQKSGLSQNDLILLLNLIFDYIEVYPEEEYMSWYQKAQKEIADPKDISFVALALAKKVDGIWSDDKDFETVTSIKIFKTKDMLSNFNT